MRKRHNNEKGVSILVYLSICFNNIAKLKGTPPFSSKEDHKVHGLLGITKDYAKDTIADFNGVFSEQGHQSCPKT